METISKLTSSDIPSVLPPSAQAFFPLLQAHASEIESVKSSTFKYGATDRHQLDVYYPEGVENGTAPVVFFAYGGGFVSGARVLPPPANLMFKNLGSFYARKGFFVVVPDYRLVPEAKFPDGAQDIKDAVVWIVDHADEVAKDSSVKLDTASLFLTAHSAGASHTITSILYPGLFQSEYRLRIKGLFLIGGPYTFRPELLPPGPSVPTDTLDKYYGPGQFQEKEPLALLEKAPQDIISSFPPIVVSRAEREPKSIEQMNIHFTKVLKQKLPGGEIKVQEYVMKGHNHVSPSMALSSGEGEEWAHYAIDWFRSQI
ncbi:hypothetical protein EIP91_003717 [Steccherinum ochraceum]|uniref:BD-FAE-like domain-containing protein n=1 Tax=Steccherinum ochraceum TaxID=92696 RepID=A0A4R0RUS0_9APHY|nr:hypothetical protein EIP91_003717 [Steccherinum ochraceum]